MKYKCPECNSTSVIHVPYSDGKIVYVCKKCRSEFDEPVDTSWYVLKNALNDNETAGPFDTKKEAILHSGFDLSPTKKINAGMYSKGRDYIGTKKELILSGFGWAFEQEENQ